MGLAGKPGPAPSTCGVLQARNKPQTHHRSCSRVGDTRVSALRTIVRDPYRTALTPHEAIVGVSPTKTFRWHANKYECIPGTDQERYALSVRASAHSSNARRSKTRHITEQNISGVRYTNYKKAIWGRAWRRKRKNLPFLAKWMAPWREGGTQPKSKAFIYSGEVANWRTTTLNFEASVPKLRRWHSQSGHSSRTCSIDSGTSPPHAWQWWRKCSSMALMRARQEAVGNTRVRTWSIMGNLATAPAGMPVPFCGNGFTTYDAWE
jgi:hypothetical protein